MLALKLHPPCDGYTIQWFSLINSRILSNTSTTTSFQITNLDYATKYVIIVNGYTSVGQGIAYTSAIAVTKSLYDTPEENVTRYYCNIPVPGYIEFNWEEMPCTIYAGTIGTLFLIVVVLVSIFACQACCQRRAPNNNVEINMTTMDDGQQDESDSPGEEDDFDETKTKLPDAQSEYSNDDRLSNPDDERLSTAKSRITGDGNNPSPSKTPTGNPDKPVKLDISAAKKIVIVQVENYNGLRSPGDSEAFSDSDYDTFDEEDAEEGAAAPRIPSIKIMTTQANGNSNTRQVTDEMSQPKIKNKQSKTSSNREKVTLQNKDIAISITDQTKETAKKKTDLRSKTKLSKPKKTANGENKKNGFVPKSEKSFDQIYEHPLGDTEYLQGNKNLAEKEDDKSKNNNTGIKINRPMQKEKLNKNTIGIGDLDNEEIGIDTSGRISQVSASDLRVQISRTETHDDWSNLETPVAMDESKKAANLIGDWDEIVENTNKPNTPVHQDSVQNQRLQSPKTDQILGDWDDIQEPHTQIKTIHELKVDGHDSDNSTTKHKLSIQRNEVITQTLQSQINERELDDWDDMEPNDDNSIYNVSAIESSVPTRHQRNRAPSNNKASVISDQLISKNNHSEAIDELDLTSETHINVVPFHISNGPKEFRTQMPGMKQNDVLSKSGDKASHDLIIPQEVKTNLERNGNCSPLSEDQQSKGQHNKATGNIVRNEVARNKKEISTEVLDEEKYRKPLNHSYSDTNIDYVDEMHLEDEVDKCSAQDDRITSPKTSAWDRRGSDGRCTKTKSKTKTPVTTFQSVRLPIIEPEPVFDTDRLAKKFPFLSPESVVEDPIPGNGSIKNNGWTGSSITDPKQQSMRQSVLDRFSFKGARRAFSETDVEAGASKKAQGGQLFYGFGVGKFRLFAAKWVQKLRRKRPTPTVDSEWG